MFGSKKKESTKNATSSTVRVELSAVEQEKINACILLQALDFEKKANRLEKSKKALTAHECEKLYNLQQGAKFYWALAKKIRGAPIQKQPKNARKSSRTNDSVTKKPARKTTTAKKPTVKKSAKKK